MTNSYCYYKNTVERRRGLAREAFGNKCGCCGYDKHIKALQFHHLDENKDRAISDLVRHIGWAKIVKELRKCVLLCPTCHVEVHLGVRKIPKRIKRFDESFATYTTSKGVLIG